MSNLWQSKRLTPRVGKVREPVLGEHFSATSLRGPAQALVREAIQNSLDAGVSGQTVRARFFISGSAGALAVPAWSTYFNEIWPHFEAKKSGVPDLPARDSTCPFVAYEDFGTKGLAGDPEQFVPLEGEKNDWFYFFRKEGDTSKQETDRGRWGVGKVVFSISSRVHSFIALTIRAADHRELLMGQAMLRSREVGGQYFVPDAWFARDRGDELEIPFEDPRLIERFKTDFRLKRSKHPGVSVVIPFPDEDIDERSVLEAVITDFFYPILGGELIVEVETPTATTEVTAATLHGLARQLPAGTSAALPSIELAQWAVNASISATLNRPGLEGALSWSTEVLPTELAEALRPTFESGQPLRLRVPLPIRKKRGATSDSFVDVILKRTGESDPGRPVFIREGLIIPDVRSRVCPGVRAIVLVDDRGAAEMLGDAENPAHTQWQQESSNFKGKYLYGPSNLRYVAESVQHIIRLLTADSTEDRTVLADLFSVPVRDEEARSIVRQKRKTAKPGTDPEPPPEYPQPRPRPLNVEKLAGGFAVKGNEGALTLPCRVQVRAAYDVRRGNPLKRYHPADFQWRDLGLEIKGAELESAEGNEILLRATNAEFDIRVTGFDESRDIVVSATVRNSDHDTQV